MHLFLMESGLRPWPEDFGQPCSGWQAAAEAFTARPREPFLPTTPPRRRAADSVRPPQVAKGLVEQVEHRTPCARSVGRVIPNAGHGGRGVSGPRGGRPVRVRRPGPEWFGWHELPTDIRHRAIDEAIRVLRLAGQVIAIDLDPPPTARTIFETYMRLAERPHARDVLGTGLADAFTAHGLAVTTHLPARSWAAPFQIVHAHKRGI